MSDRAKQLALRAHLQAAVSEANGVGGEILDDLETALLRIDAEIAEAEPGMVEDPTASIFSNPFSDTSGGEFAPPEAHFGVPGTGPAGDPVSVLDIPANAVEAPQGPTLQDHREPMPRITVTARNPEHQQIAQTVQELVRAYLRGELTGLARELVELAAKVDLLERFGGGQ